MRSMHNTTQQILLMLTDGRFHSGQSLAMSLDISRTAVWQHISVLRSYGLNIDAVNGRGYRFASAYDPLLASTIKQNLSEFSSSHLPEICVLPVTGSTNAEIRASLTATGSTNKVIFSEYQTDGRGRRGKTWFAPFGQSLLFSLSWQYHLPPTALGGLSLVVGSALVHALRELGLESVSLKWPNDLYAHHKKLGGILIEMLGDHAGPCTVIIGIGLNVCDINTTAINQPAIALVTLLNKIINRNTLAGMLLNQLTMSLHQFETGGFHSFQKSWSKYDYLLNKAISIQGLKQPFHGTAKGVDEKGGLIVEDDKGVSHVFYTGDVSVRVAACC